MSLSKETTEVWLNASELLILLCGLVLAFGAAGEYLEDHEKLPRWMAWSRKPKLVFVWMVAISLVGEFVGDAGVFIFSGHLQTIADGEYAALNREAGTARRDAGKANERAASLEKESAKLNERIVEMGPRDLLFGPKQEAEFIKTLALVRGQKVQLRECLNSARFDQEVIRLSNRLEFLFRAAGWDIASNPSREVDEGTPVWDSGCDGRRGIDVGTKSTASNRSIRAAAVLQEALGHVPLGHRRYSPSYEKFEYGIFPYMKPPPRVEAFFDPERVVVLILPHP